MKPCKTLVQIKSIHFKQNEVRTIQQGHHVYIYPPPIYLIITATMCTHATFSFMELQHLGFELLILFLTII